MKNVIRPEAIAELCPGQVCEACPLIGYVALLYSMLEDRKALTPPRARVLAREVITRSGNMCKTGPKDGECQSAKPVPEFVRTILETNHLVLPDRTSSDEDE